MTIINLIPFSINLPFSFAIAYILAKCAFSVYQFYKINQEYKKKVQDAEAESSNNFGGQSSTENEKKEEMPVQKPCFIPIYMALIDQLMIVVLLLMNKHLFTIAITYFRTLKDNWVGLEELEPNHYEGQGIMSVPKSEIGPLSLFLVQYVIMSSSSKVIFLIVFILPTFNSKSSSISYIIYKHAFRKGLSQITLICLHLLLLEMFGRYIALVEFSYFVYSKVLNSSGFDFHQNILIKNFSRISDKGLIQSLNCLVKDVYFPKKIQKEELSDEIEESYFFQNKEKDELFNTILTGYTEEENFEKNETASVEVNSTDSSEISDYYDEAVGKNHVFLEKNRIFTPREIKALFAHELGHVLNNHYIKKILFETVKYAIVYFIFKILFHTNSVFGYETLGIVDYYEYIEPHSEEIGFWSWLFGFGSSSNSNEEIHVILDRNYYLFDHVIIYYFVNDVCNYIRMYYESTMEDDANEFVKNLGLSKTYEKANEKLKKHCDETDLKCINELFKKERDNKNEKQKKKHLMDTNWVSNLLNEQLN